jgi:predicted aspartyl protease
MGRIVAQVKITNPLDKTKELEFSALVDTGAAYLTLPLAWREKLGEMDDVRRVTAQVADQRNVEAQIAGPVRIQIENFPAAYTEILFLDMGDAPERYEPLLGHLPLQQSQISIDMVNHCLFPVKYVDCK